MELLANMLATEYIDNPRGWSFDHVTTPRESCLKAHGARLRLQRLLIGDVALFGTLMVARVTADKYDVGGRKCTFDNALAILEGRKPTPEPKRKPTKPRARKPARPRKSAAPVGVLPLPLEFVA